MIRAVCILAVFAAMAYVLGFATFGSGLDDSTEFQMYFILGLCGGVLAALAYRSEP